MKVLQQALQDQGAHTRVLSLGLGVVPTSSGQQLVVDHTLVTRPSVLFDAVMVPAGAASARALCERSEAVQFMLEAYRHGKPLCLIGEGAELLWRVVSREQALPGVVLGRNDPADRLPMAQAFIQAIARHRHPGRPPAQSAQA
jgi:catalase